MQEAIQSREERFRGAHAVGWLLLVVAAILVIGSVLFVIVDGIRRDFSFGQFFLRLLILLEGYKVWDMIFLNWYLLAKPHFYQHYFPEVEGCGSLKHTGFNRKEKLMKLCVIFPVASIALTGICTLIGYLI